MDTPVNQTERFTAQVTQLHQLLLRKAQGNGGNIDILAMELKLQIMQEHVTLLTELLVKASGPQLSDEFVTKLLADRLDTVIALLTKETTSPLIAVANGMPPRANGRH